MRDSCCHGLVVAGEGEAIGGGVDHLREACECIDRSSDHADVYFRRGAAGLNPGESFRRPGHQFTCGATGDTLRLVLGTYGDVGVLLLEVEPVVGRGQLVDFEPFLVLKCAEVVSCGNKDVDPKGSGAPLRRESGPSIDQL